jgi:hypothetical protein
MRTPVRVILFAWAVIILVVLLVVMIQDFPL